jgi:hypothetical protein
MQCYFQYIDIHIFKMIKISVFKPKKVILISWEDLKSTFLINF